MAAQFLADPNEDQEAADFYLEKFGKEGVEMGGPLHLVVRVSKIPLEKLNAVEAKLNAFYDCARLERGQSGLIFKKPTVAAYLEPGKLERDYLLGAARSLYRLILEEDVAVEIENRDAP